MGKKKKKVKLKKGVWIFLVVLLLLCVLGGFGYYKYRNYLKEQTLIKREEKIIKEIKSHYGERVITNKETKLYSKDGKKYNDIGSISAGEVIKLNPTLLDKDIKYFYSEELGYYVYYKDVEPTDTEFVKDDRYKKYVMFNENVVTKDMVHLYRGDKVVYTLKSSLDVPILYKGDLGVYIEYSNEALLVKNEDITNIYSKSNTNSEEASSVPVTVYHFIFLDGDTSCNEAICHHEHQIKEHFQYLNDNGFFTINTTELRYFIEGKLRLPKKSILITIDDGARAEKFIPIMEEYKINATLFLISSWYPKEKFSSKYMEVASHTHDLHRPRTCSGGQGSPMKCYDWNKLIADLTTSRNYLGTDAFCYPFYEYNDYSIKALKAAGFKIAFRGGSVKATKGIDLYKVPRIPLNRYTTISQYAKYIN